MHGKSDPKPDERETELTPLTGFPLPLGQIENALLGAKGLTSDALIKFDFQGR